MQQANLALSAELFAETAHHSDNPNLSDCPQALCLAWRGYRATASKIVARVLDRLPENVAALYLKYLLASKCPGKSPNTVLTQLLGKPAKQSELVSFINRYDVPGWRALDDKASLTKLIQMEDDPGKNGRISHCPKTFIMPEQRSRLLKRASHGPWIAMHSALFGGQGMVITADASATPDSDGWIVQRYVDEPLLVQSRKSHVRIYLLIEGIEPFRAFLYGNGIVRHAPLAYSPASEGVTQDGAHITNTTKTCRKKLP